MEISKERWLEAQEAEQRFHSNMTLDELRTMYNDSYRQYFEYLDIKYDQQHKHIIEVGCAEIPALYFCRNYKYSVIIEPLPTLILEELTRDMNVSLIKRPAENTGLFNYDEVWLFNVLQHVIDPDKLIDKMKNAAKRIRFFEPVNTEIDDYHPHAFTYDDFTRWFGEFDIYEENKEAINFHTHECVYGIYDHV